MRRTRLAWLALGLWTSVAANTFADPQSDGSQPTDKPLVFIQQGEIPLLITAPHGGRETIPGIAPRKGGENVYRFVAEPDENTGELTDALVDELERVLERKPFVVRARFSRKYCDVNREPKDAYESPAAKTNYDAYHGAIQKACHTILERWHAGLLLDIHGQSGFPDKLIRGTNNGRTLTMLAERRGAEAFMGQSSLFGQMRKAGYEVLPRIDTTELEPERYAGGFTVRTYGSHQPGGIDAIQLEFGRDYRLPLARAEKSAGDLAEAIASYARDYLPAALPEAAAVAK